MICFHFRKFVLLIVFPILDKNQSFLRPHLYLRVNQSYQGAFWFKNRTFTSRKMFSGILWKNYFIRLVALRRNQEVAQGFIYRDIKTRKIWGCGMQKIFTILKKCHYIHKKWEFDVTFLESVYLGLFSSRSQSWDEISDHTVGIY